MFRLLDVRGKGYLDAATINYFFKEVVSKLAGAGHDPVNPADVQVHFFINPYLTFAWSPLARGLPAHRTRSSTW